METRKPENNRHHPVKFKSYYVVWKPGNAQLFKHVLERLNRTMQYGNIFI